MRLNRLFTIMLLMVLVIGSSVTANELTLNDCIELALQNRVSILVARGSEDIAKAGKRSALGAFLPRIDASYNYSKGKETDIDPTAPYATEYATILDTTDIGGQIAVDAVTVPIAYMSRDEQDIGPSKSLSVSASMWLLNVGNYFSLAEANARADAAHLDVINSEQDLIYSVKLTYYAYLASVENVDVQKEAVKRSEEQLKLIQSRYDLGSASLSDVLKQKVQFGNDQLTLLTAKNSVVTNKASLAYTIGLDPNAEHDFSRDYSVNEYFGTLEDAISFGLEHEPGYLSTQKGLIAAKKSVCAARSEYLPKLSASASYTKFNGTQAFPTVFDYSSTTTRYGFNISWSVFDGFLRERSVTSAKISRNNAMAQVSETKNFLAREIKTAYYGIEQQKQSKEIAQTNVEAANEDLKITQEKYNLGAATILDLLNAQVSLKSAQVSLIRADFDLNLAIAKLENAMGKM